MLRCLYIYIHVDIYQTQGHNCNTYRTNQVKVSWSHPHILRKGKKGMLSCSGLKGNTKKVLPKCLNSENDPDKLPRLLLF